MKPFLTLLFALLLSGCATSFEKPPNGTDYGNYPSNYEDLIKSHMQTVLIDPESARYRFQKPRRAYANQGLLYGGKIAWMGYAVEFFVNAKNRYGGYTGGTTYVALIRDQRVVKCEERDYLFVKLTYAE